MGVTIGFARLSSDSEILALKASGISIYQILPPVIIVVSVISLLTGYFSVKLIPLSETSMRLLVYQLLSEKIDKGIKEHTFTEALGDVVVYVDNIDKKSGEWKNVWVSDMRGVTNPVITMASTGTMKSDIENMMVSIVLRNGSLHRPNNENAQIVQFDKYMIDIPLSLGSTKATRSNRGEFTMEELSREVSLIPENTRHKRKLLIEYHKRLVLPVGCLMISLLGLPLGLQARPGKKAIGIQAGLAIFVLYYILFTLAKGFAEEGVLSVPLAMWIPNGLFLLLVFYWIIQIANEKPLIPESVVNFARKMLKSLSHPLLISYDSIKTFLIAPDSADQETSDSSTSLKVKKMIRGNVKSRVFHLPQCQYYDGKNCTIEFKNYNIALEAGFEPCRFCKDLIDD